MGSALNKLIVGECPRQTEEKKGSAINKLSVGWCPKQAKGNGMSQTNWR